MKLGMSLLMIATLSYAELTSPARLCAQGPRYKVIDLGTSGGPQSYLNIPSQYARILNNSGAVAGWADTSTPDPFRNSNSNFCFDQDCWVSKAFQWQNDVRADLDELVPGYSSQANWISATGLVVGLAQNGETDPSILTVQGSPLQNRAVLWNNSSVMELGTLPGGYESVASAVNNQGLVVGWALDATPDPNSMSCPGFCTTETRAFIWQKGGMIQDLGTLGGTDAMALLVNDLGQVVGDSYTNSNPSAYCAQQQGFPLTTGAFIWQEGKGMEDLGNFGGTCTFASALNSKGQIVGGSTLPGDLAQHPFLWEEGVLKDLGTFGGSLGSAIAISDEGEVVGWASVSGDRAQHAFLWNKEVGMTDLITSSGFVSPGFPNSFAVDVNEGGTQIVGFLGDRKLKRFHAFVWQKNHMYDLDALIAGSGLQLGGGVANINDLGEIAGNATDVNGQSHAVLLVPCEDNDSTCSDAAASPLLTPSPATTMPTDNLNDARHRMLRRRLAPLGISLAATSSAPNTSNTSIIEPLKKGAGSGGSGGGTGGGTGSSATLSPTSLRFLCRNADNVGCECLNLRTTTLTNSGNANLSIKSIATTGAFTQTNNCGMSLGPGQSCTISVRWSLTNSVGFVDFSDSAPGSPQTVSLSGYKTCTPL